MADPTPSPPTGIRWDELRGFLWSCVASCHPANAGPRIKGVARGVYSHSPNVVCTGILAGLLVFAVGSHGCTLPTLPPWPWFNPTPGPLTALEKSFHDAYAADTDAQKADHVAKLAEMTDAFVPRAKQAGTVKTAGDLYTAWQSATSILIGKGALPNVGKAIAVYLDTKLPTVKSQPMTDDLWNTAISEFSIVSAALKKGAK